jgi:hypothetical protein
MGEEERKDEEKPVSSKDDERKEYNMGVLKQIQTYIYLVLKSFLLKIKYHSNVMIV